MGGAARRLAGACTGHVPQRGGIVLPRLKRSPAPQRRRAVLGVPPQRPIQQPGDEVLEAQQHLVLRTGGTFAGGAAGGRSRAGGAARNMLSTARFRPSRCPWMRGIGGQVLHRHIQEIERGGHRPGHAVLATVHPYLLGHAAERAVGILTQDRGAQRGQHRLPRRIPRRYRDAGDRVRRAVGEPGDPRPAGLALDVDQHRGLHVVRLPHLVAPAPRPGQEYVVLARRPLPSRKSGPLPRRQITADRPVQRRQGRCVCRGRLPGSTQDQFAVDRPHVPLPQRQQAPDLGRDREPCIDPGACAGVGGRGLIALSGGQPAPHRALQHSKRIRGHSFMDCCQLLPCPQCEQPPHGRTAQRRPRRRRQSAAS